MKIYIVLRGHYSDRHICGVATNPDIAERIKTLCSDPDPEYDYGHAYIEEYDTNIWYPLGQGGKLYRVWMYSDGRVDVQEITDDYEYESYLQGGGGRVWRQSFGNEILCTNVFAINEEHAKKIACDRRAEYLAQQEGI